MEEVGEEEDVGDDVDEVEDDKDVGVVAFGDVVGVVGQEEEGGEEAQQEDLVGQSFEGDRVLNLGQICMEAISDNVLNGERHREGDDSTDH